MVHLLLHLLIPWWTALAWYRSRWRRATGVMLATMAVDVDHLLAQPIYDPQRCSIGFHPLHTTPAIVGYVLLFALPWWFNRSAEHRGWDTAVRTVHWIGLGLLIHMALDGLDCVI